MDKGRPESVGFDEIIIISQHKTVLLLLVFFFIFFSPFQIYFVKQVNEYKNKSINACLDVILSRWPFKNKIVGYSNRLNCLSPLKFVHACLLSGDFAPQNELFRTIVSRIQSECQIDWIQIRPEVLLGLIWVQTVCKDFQQTTLVANDWALKNK